MATNSKMAIRRMVKSMYDAKKYKKLYVYKKKPSRVCIKFRKFS